MRFVFLVPCKAMSPTTLVLNDHSLYSCIQVRLEKLRRIVAYMRHWSVVLHVMKVFIAGRHSDETIKNY